jgi:hypothetical protein
MMVRVRFQSAIGSSTTPSGWCFSSLARIRWSAAGLGWPLRGPMAASYQQRFADRGAAAEWMPMTAIGGFTEPLQEAA